MKVGVNPEIAKIADLLSIMNSREKAMFMRMVDAIENTVKENHKEDEKEN
jgi:hypothetical protein